MIALALAMQAASTPVTPAQVQRAQIAMLREVTALATAYRVKLGLPYLYQRYCQIRVNIALKDTSRSPGFPTDWNRITTQADLDLAINAEMTFQVPTFQLCLADVKRRFDQAGSIP